MRTNLPVTQRSYAFPRGETLVSTTDLKGRITYVNPAFVTVSGYTKEELLGQPHNLIRHPDMPEEAFRDMWATIASGEPWTALVKNRRKDGDHYWVVANVTPLMAGGSPLGFMSVRTEPTPQQVQEADALYARMRDEARAGTVMLRLKSGHLQRSDLRSRMAAALRLPPALRLGVMVSALVGSGLAAGLWLGGHAAGALGLTLASCTFLGAGLALGAWLHRRTDGPLLDLLRFAHGLAAGDLTAELKMQRDDLAGRLGRALNQLSVNVRSIVRDVRTEVDQMHHATTEIANGNLDLSSRTESQASSLQQTAASMEEITGTVRQSAGNAREAAALAQDADEITRRSSAAVDDVARTMQAISDASRRIGEIIQVIDGIAFQTNILALNAAVEAARAGEQGRGFAVVAAEVRALAQRTTAAAREVKALIEDSTQKVAAGARMTDGARETMNAAMEKVNRVASLIREFDTSASEQLTGISQVNEAVTQLDQITQQNAALVEQLAASASTMQGQALVVADSVRVFRLGNDAAPPDAVALRRAQREPLAA